MTDSQPKFTRKELNIAFWHGVAVYEANKNSSSDEIDTALVRAFDSLESKFLKGDYSMDPRSINYYGAQEVQS